MRKLRAIWLLASCLCASGLFAGLRGPGKYDGVVFFDRWDTCILFSSTYLMYVSEAVKEPLRPDAGQSIELDVQSVSQPINPGDGLIQKYGHLAPAIQKDSDAELSSLAVKAEIASSIQPREFGITMGIYNTSKETVDVRGRELGFAVLTRRPRLGDTTDASDGESIALITRVNAETATGKGGQTMGGVFKEYAFHLDAATRLPEVVSLRPGQEVKTTIYFDLPPGEYQFLGGYGGGMHKEKLIISNAVSFDVGEDHRISVVN